MDEKVSLTIETPTIMELLLVLKILDQYDEDLKASSAMSLIYKHIELNDDGIVLNGIKRVTGKVHRYSLNEIINSIESYIPEVQYNVEEKKE